MAVNKYNQKRTLIAGFPVFMLATNKRMKCENHFFISLFIVIIIFLNNLDERGEI